MDRMKLIKWQKKCKTKGELMYKMDYQQYNTFVLKYQIPLQIVVVYMQGHYSFSIGCHEICAPNTNEMYCKHHHS
jgi:hypothetical protein